MFDLDLLYFSAVDWSFRRLPHHYICEEVLRRGGRVYFVENTGVRWPGWHDLHRVTRRVRRLFTTAPRGLAFEHEGIRIVPPVALPPSGSRLIRSLNRTLVHAQLRRVVGEIRTHRTVAFVTVPNWTSYDVVRAISPAVTVYFCADEFARVPGADPSIRSSEDALLREADVVFVTSRRLGELAARIAPRPIVIPVGVDAAAFRPAADGLLERPAALARITGPIIGYIGGLNHKVDIKLLEAVADAFPSAHVVLLGDIDDPRYSPRRRPNLTLLTGHSHAEVPAFLQYFNVCLIPYLRTEFTDSVYPAKLNEYLAAGRAVVSTALPEIRPFAPVVRIAEGHAEFIAAVRAALDDRPDPTAVEARIAIASASSYERVIPRMLAEIEDAMDRRQRRAGALHPSLSGRRSPADHVLEERK